MSSTDTYTVEIDHAVGERDIWAAVEAGRAVGATYYRIMAPWPPMWDAALGRAVARVGTYRAAAGRIDRPMKTAAEVRAQSGA